MLWALRELPPQALLGGGLGPALRGGEAGVQCPREQHADWAPLWFVGASSECRWLHLHSPAQKIKFELFLLNTLILG